MKSRWKLVTCHCQHTSNLNRAWRGQSCKHHFGHLFNTTLKHSSLSSSRYFPCIFGWDMSALAIHVDWTGPGYAKLLYSWVDALHPGAWMNNPPRGHQASWEMAWLGVIPRVRQLGCWREKGLVAWTSTTLGQQAPVRESSLRNMSSGCKYSQPPSKAEPSSPVLFSPSWNHVPSSVPTMPEQGQLLPQPPPSLAAILSQNCSLLFFLFKHPRKCEVDCTSPTLGRPRGLPCLPVGLSRHKKIRFSLSPSKLEEFLACVILHVGLKRELKKIM